MFSTHRSFRVLMFLLFLTMVPQTSLVASARCCQARWRSCKVPIQGLQGLLLHQWKKKILWMEVRQRSQWKLESRRPSAYITGGGRGEPSGSSTQVWGPIRRFTSLDPKLRMFCCLLHAAAVRICCYVCCLWIYCNLVTIQHFMSIMWYSDIRVGWWEDEKTKFWSDLKRLFLYFAIIVFWHVSLWCKIYLNCYIWIFVHLWALLSVTVLWISYDERCENHLYLKTFSLSLL